MPKYWGSLTDEDDALVDENQGAPVDFSKLDPDAKDPVLVPPEAMRSKGTARQWYLTEGPGKDKNKGLSIPRATNVKPVEQDEGWEGTPFKVPNQDILEREVRRQGPVAQQARRNLMGATGAKAGQQVAHMDEREAGLTLPREDEPWIEKGGFLGIQSPRLSTAIGGRANPILARALEDPSEKRVKFPSLEELQGVARSLGGTPEKVPSTPGEFVDTAVDTAIGQTIPGRLYQASKKFTAASGSLPKALYEYGETLLTPRLTEAAKAVGDYGVEKFREKIGEDRQWLNARHAAKIERQRKLAQATGEPAPYTLPETHAATMRDADVFNRVAKGAEHVAQGVNTAGQAAAGFGEVLLTPTNLALMKAPGALTKLAKRGGEVSSITGLGETSVAQRLREGAAKAGAEHNAALAEAKTLKDAATASAVKQAGLETPEAVEGAWGGIRNLLTSDVNPGLVPGKGWWNSPMRTATTKRIKADILGTAAKTVVNEPLMRRAVGAYYTYQMAKELPQNFDRITQGGEEFFRTGDQKKLQEILPDVTSAAMLFMMAKHQLGQARGNLGGERFRTDKGIAEYRQRTRMPAYDLTDAKIQKDFVKEAFVGKRVVDHGDGLYGIRQGNSLDLARVKFVKPEDVKVEVDPATGEKKAHDAWITPPSAGAPPTIHLVAKTDMGLIKHEQTHLLTDMGALTGSLRDIEKELGLEHGAIQDTASIAKLRAELVERQATAPPEAQKNIADQIGRLDKAAKGIEAFPELVERTLGTSSSYEQSIEQIYKIKNGPMPNILDVFEKAKKGDREAMAEIKDRGLGRLYTDTMILGSPEQVAKARRNQWFETAKFLLTGKKSAADVARDIAEGRFDMTGAKPPNPLYSAEEIARGKEPVAEAPPVPAPVDAVGKLREVATQNAALKKQYGEMDKAKAPVADMKPVAQALDQSERDLHRAQADAAEQMKQHEEVTAKQLADLDKQIAAVDQSTNVGKLEARELKEKAETIHKELEELRGLMKKPAGPEPAPPPPVPGSVEEKQAFLDDTMAKMDATVEQTAQQLVKQQADEAKARTDIAQKMAEVGQKKVAEEVANREAARADIAKKMAEVVKGNAERVTSLSDVPSEAQGQRQTAQSWQARFEPAPEAGSERVGPVAPELGKSPDKFSMRTATGDLQRDMSERDKMFGMPQQGTDAPSAQHLGEVTLARLGIKTNEKVDGLDKAGTKWVPSGPEENSGTLVVANKDGTPGVVYKLSAGKILGAWNTSAKVDMWSEPTKRGPKGTIRNLLNKTAPDSLQRRAQAALAERGVKRFPAIETLSEYGIRSVDLFTPDQESMKLFRRWEKDPRTLVGKVEYQQGDSRAGQKLTLDQIKKGLSDLTKDSNAFTPESFAIHMREMDQVRDIYKLEGGGRLAVMAAGHNVPTREEANAGRDTERPGVALGRRAEEVGEPTPVGQGERAGNLQADRAGDGGAGTDLGGGNGRFASRGAVEALDDLLAKEQARARKRGGEVTDDALFLISDVRKAAGIPKEDFDRQVLKLAEDGVLQLQSHDRPKDLSEAEKDSYIPNGRGSYFIAAGYTQKGLAGRSPVDVAPFPEAEKKASESPFPEAETPLFASRTLDKARREIVDVDGDALSEPDGFLYHVTSLPAAKRIVAGGFKKGAPRMFEHGVYDSHGKDKVFLTELNGVNFWKEKVEAMLFDRFDDPPDVAVIRIPKEDLRPELEKDETGTADARADAHFVRYASRQAETPEFKKWFGDSKVVDKDGKPRLVYHGTGDSRFSEFETNSERWGLFGNGAYFTDNPEVASGYAKPKRDALKRAWNTLHDEALATYRKTAKEFGESSKEAKQAWRALDPDLILSRVNAMASGQGVYPVWLSIANPMRMEAPADPRWKESFDVGGAKTNEEAFKEAELGLRGEGYSRYEGAEALREAVEGMGYDGITHIGGGRVDKTSDVRHQVWIAFRPEQIKSATGNRGTFDPENPDIRFASRGASRPLSDRHFKKKEATDEFREFFGDWRKDPENASKIVAKSGRPLPVYHGTNKTFFRFKDEKIGDATGNTGWFGRGHYFTANMDYAADYTRGREGGSVAPVYLNIRKPFKVEVFETDYDGEITPSVMGDTGMRLEALSGWTKAEVDRFKYLGMEDGEIFPTVGAEPLIAPERLREVLLANGYDGVVVSRTVEKIKEGREDYPETTTEPFFEIVAFDPKQIKSTFNTGAFGTRPPKDAEFESMAYRGGDKQMHPMTREKAESLQAEGDTRFASRAAQLPPHLQAMADDLQRRRGIPGPRKRADLGEATAVTDALFDETWEMAEIERITKWREHPEYRDEWDSPVLVAKDAKSAGTENLFIKGVGSGGSKVKLSNGREVEVGPIILNRQTGKFEFATYVNSQGQTEYVSSLKSILSGMGKDKANRLNDFRQFQHALDLDAAGVEHGTGYTRAEMQAFVDAVRNDPRQADIVKKSEQLTAYFNSLGDYAVSKGAIDAGVWAALKKRWPNFSPMERLFEQETGGDGAGNKAGTGSPLRNVKGSKLPVVDEIWQAIDRTHRWISQVDRNMAAANLWRMQNSIEGALGGIAEPAKKKHTPLTPAQGLTPEGEIVTRRAKAQGKTLSVDEANQLGALIEPRHDFDKSTSVVSVVVDGKVKELRVDDTVRDFLKALNRVPDAPSNSRTVRVLTALATHPTSFLKWMVTGMPAFQMAQMVRDPATGTMQTRGAGGLARRLFVQPVSGRVLPLVEIARDAGRALGAAFGRVQSMDEARFQAMYQRSAGMFSNMSAHDFETKTSVFNEIQDAIRYGNKAGTAIHYLKPGELKWGHFLDNWLQIIEKGKAPFESGTRKAIARQTLKAGRNDLVAGTYARENTTNFATFGSAKWIRDANRFLPFLNAGLQSSRKFYLTMTGYDPITGKKSPKAAAEVMAKAFLWQTVPTMILWALNKGDDTIEEQRKGKNGLYYNYIRTPNIPELPEAIRGKVVAQPKAFTWSTVFSTIPEAMLDALYEEKPEYLEENLIKPVRAMFNKDPHVYDAQKEVDYKPLGRVAKGLGNELKAGGLSPWVNAYLGLKSNTDPFYGGKIEMEYQRKMDAPLRQGYRTGQLSKDLSQGMFSAAEKIDDTKAAEALGTNVKGAVPGPDQVAFLANQVGLRDFYNLADRAYSEGTKREMPKGDYPPWQDLLGRRRIFPPENRGTGFASETFSEIAEKAEAAVSSKKQLKKTDPLMLREYIEKRDIGFATAITKLKEKIDGLQQKRAKISQMMTKDPAERKRILDDLTNQIRGFQRRVIILTNDREKKRGAE